MVTGLITSRKKLYVLVFTKVRISDTEVPTIRQLIELHLLAQFRKVTGISSPDSRITCFPEDYPSMYVTCLNRYLDNCLQNDD